LRYGIQIVVIYVIKSEGGIAPGFLRSKNLKKPTREGARD